MSEAAKNAVMEGKTALGIEFGSTRIKAVLIDENHAPIAMGTWDWKEISGPTAWRISGTVYRAATAVWQRMCRINTAWR